MVKKIFIFSLIILGISLVVYFVLGMNTNSAKIVKLWDESNIKNLDIEPDDRAEAEIWIYSPDSLMNNGKAILICPGGSYVGHAIEHEGTQFAKWLNRQGITGVVLKYRLPKRRKEVPLADAHQAMKYLREHAAKLHLKSDQIGIAGFSAGGHLAAMASTKVEDRSVRPDFTILFYPVISMKDSVTHMGSRRNLLGVDPTEEDKIAYSCEEQVTADTPPTLLFVSEDDEAVLPKNTYLYFEALSRQNIPASIHSFHGGGHGWGMQDNFKNQKQMLSLLKAWLNDINEKKI